MTCCLIGVGGVCIAELNGGIRDSAKRVMCRIAHPTTYEGSCASGSNPAHPPTSADPSSDDHSSLARPPYAAPETDLSELSAPTLGDWLATRTTGLHSASLGKTVFDGKESDVAWNSNGVVTDAAFIETSEATSVGLSDVFDRFRLAPRSDSSSIGTGLEALLASGYDFASEFWNGNVDLLEVASQAAVAVTTRPGDLMNRLADVSEKIWNEPMSVVATVKRGATDFVSAPIEAVETSWAEADRVCAGDGAGTIDCEAARNAVLVVGATQFVELVRRPLKSVFEALRGPVVPPLPGEPLNPGTTFRVSRDGSEVIKEIKTDVGTASVPALRQAIDRDRLELWHLDDEDRRFLVEATLDYTADLRSVPLLRTAVPDLRRGDTPYQIRAPFIGGTSLDHYPIVPEHTNEMIDELTTAAAETWRLPSPDGLPIGRGFVLRPDGSQSNFYLNQADRLAEGGWIDPTFFVPPDHLWALGRGGPPWWIRFSRWSEARASRRD